MSSQSRNPKLERTLERFKAKIDQGSYYEASLTIQTIVSRYVKMKNYNDSIELLYHAALTLLELKQSAPGCELFLKLIDLLKNLDGDHNNYDLYLKQQLPKFLQLLQEIPKDDPALSDIAKELITYSISITPYKLGDPILNFNIGKKFLMSGNMENYYKAEQFLILSGDNDNALDLYIELLHQWYLNDETKDFTTYFIRLIINYLYVGNIKFALKGFKKLVDKLELKNYTLKENGFLLFENEKLLNFLQLLIRVIQRSEKGSFNIFKNLINRYKELLLERNLLNPLNYLSKLYFNETILQQQNNDIFQNLMSGFLRGNN
ncbi:hypothetical protein PACTADRAFT_50464 [Pachysolen tannophilus NRRL Y-2460]|uniref:Golgi to ER traffic protein 4 n=1 Tax=Pachysolen tannophilus NRRL Y-2460 TaxID=669874 RepID=A0A1E4TSD9_PACTA|nr:hypothetical protein PACTADRAFT_50464 [Pachysolen tannophilus NRRL Y-2460]